MRCNDPASEHLTSPFILPVGFVTDPVSPSPNQLEPGLVALESELEAMLVEYPRRAAIAVSGIGLGYDLSTWNQGRPR